MKKELINRIFKLVASADAENRNVGKCFIESCSASDFDVLKTEFINRSYKEDFTLFVHYIFEPFIKN